MLYVFDCVNCVSNLRGKTYTRTDVYGNYDCTLLHRKLHAWSNAYRKMVNLKVKNYDLRNLDKETNMKVLNLFMSGWQLIPLRE